MVKELCVVTLLTTPGGELLHQSDEDTLRGIRLAKRS